MSAERNEHEERPSARQMLHWATGDREAEAKALADEADDEVTEADAEVAVRRAHGDTRAEESPIDTDVAGTSDAEAVHEAKSSRRS